MSTSGSEIPYPLHLLWQSQRREQTVVHLLGIPLIGGSVFKKSRVHSDGIQLRAKEMLYV